MLRLFRMVRSHSESGSSLVRIFESGSSSAGHPIGAMLKCKHKTPVVYETCRKERNYGRKFFGCKFWKANRGCGFFIWEDELDKYLIEKNIMLEERMAQMDGEMARMQAELSRLRNGTQNNIKMEEELTKLRGKLEIEKKKRKASEAKVEAMREEMFLLKQGGLKRNGLLKFVVFVVVVVVIVYNVRG